MSDWFDKRDVAEPQASDNYEYRIEAGGSRLELEKYMNTDAKAGFRFIAFQACQFGSILVGFAVMERAPPVVTLLSASEK